MSKSLLKITIADQISRLAMEIKWQKVNINNLYDKCDKSNSRTETYFIMLNARRDELRHLKRKLRNLEKLQKRIKQLPDELLDTSLPLFMQKMTNEEAKQLGL